MVVCHICGKNNLVPNRPKPRATYRCRSCGVRLEVRLAEKRSMSRKLLLTLAAFLTGLAIQVVGELINKFVYIQLLPSNLGLVELLFGLLGFGVMGVCFYRWVLKPRPRLWPASHER